MQPPCQPAAEAGAFRGGQGCPKEHPVGVQLRNPARNVMGVEMQSLEANWRFVRTPPSGKACGPVSLDALHALQCWRVGHPGRAFKLVRSSPFQPSDQVRARLSHGLLDQGADEDLRLWCRQHSVAAAALPPSA